MKGVVVCYSLSGNNERVARGVAARLGLELIKVSEPISRRAINTVLDIVFNRTPKVTPSPEIIKGFELVVIFAPVWIGHIAPTLRSYLDYIRVRQLRYGLVSVCGGPNPKVKNELIRRTGREPEFFLELYIADLLPAGVKPTIKSVMAYRLTDEDMRQLTEKVVSSISQRLAG